MKNERDGTIIGSIAALLLASRLFAVAETSSLTPVTVFQTGGGASFLSSTQAVHFSLAGSRAIEFGFGFATDETVAANTFFDSLTFTFAGATNSQTAILATVDTSGVNWAPVTPGTVPLNAQQFSIAPIEFSSGANTSLSKQLAFWLRVTVPDEMNGDDFYFYSDFFDNGNGVASMAWFTPVTVVPEPSTWAILGVAVVFLFAFKWRTE